MTGQRNKTNKWIWCPASTRLWPVVDLMLGQRRSDAGPTLNQLRVKVTGTVPFHAHAGEREDGADHGDVLEVVHQLTHHLPKLPAEREELGKLKKHNVIHIIYIIPVKRSPNVEVMMGRRLRRRPIITSTLGHCLMWYSSPKLLIGHNITNISASP